MLTREGTQSLVRRYYLGETQLPALSPATVLICVLCALEFLALHILVQFPDSSFLDCFPLAWV